MALCFFHALGDTVAKKKKKMLKPLKHLHPPKRMERIL